MSDTHVHKDNRLSLSKETLQTLCQVDRNAELISIHQEMLQESIELIYTLLRRVKRLEDWKDRVQSAHTYYDVEDGNWPTMTKFNDKSMKFLMDMVDLYHRTNKFKPTEKSYGYG